MTRVSDSSRGLCFERVSFGYQAPSGFNAGGMVLRDVDCAVVPGQVLAIVGPNGAGKSTLVRLGAGLLQPKRGRVLLHGVDVSAMSPAQRAEHLACVPQRPSAAFAYSLGEVVSFGAGPGGVSGVVRSLVTRALEEVALAESASMPFAYLSVGQQQRGALARALVQLRAAEARAGHDQRGGILLADEPVSAADPAHALRTIALLRKLASDGVAVAMVIHDLSLALRFADACLLLGADGRVAAHGASADVLTPELLEQVFCVRFARMQVVGEAHPTLVPLRAIEPNPAARTATRA